MKVRRSFELSMSEIGIRFYAMNISRAIFISTKIKIFGQLNQLIRLIREIALVGLIEKLLLKSNKRMIKSSFAINSALFVKTSFYIDLL